MSEVVSGRKLTTIVLDEDEVEALTLLLSQVEYEPLQERLFSLADSLGALDGYKDRDQQGSCDGCGKSYSTSDGRNCTECGSHMDCCVCESGK